MNPAIKTASISLVHKRNWALLAKFHSRPSISGFTTKQRYPEHVGNIVTATGGVVKAYRKSPGSSEVVSTHEKNAA